jgi:hypothetical protein
MYEGVPDAAIELDRDREFMGGSTAAVTVDGGSNSSL